jgi:hypothetical protein
MGGSTFFLFTVLMMDGNNLKLYFYLLLSLYLESGNKEFGLYEIRPP